MNSRDATIAYCKSKYDAKTFQHCEMVAFYAITSPCATQETKDAIFKMAMCHDLLEGTDATITEICRVTGLKKGFVESVLRPLTKEDGEDYQIYIKRLRATQNPYVYIIKIADMKDHLLRAQTLTDKLKDKYWKALPELL